MRLVLLALAVGGPLQAQEPLEDLSPLPAPHDPLTTQPLPYVVQGDTAIITLPSALPSRPTRKLERTIAK